MPGSAGQRSCAWSTSSPRTYAKRPHRGTMAGPVSVLGTQIIPGRRDCPDPAASTPSPTPNTSSPTTIASNPQQNTSSPTTNTSSPTRLTSNPTRNTSSPTRLTRSPTRLSSSPATHTSDPKGNTSCPTEFSARRGRLPRLLLRHRDEVEGVAAHLGALDVLLR